MRLQDRSSTANLNAKLHVLDLANMLKSSLRRKFKRCSRFGPVSLRKAISDSTKGRPCRRARLQYHTSPYQDIYPFILSSTIPWQRHSNRHQFHNSKCDSMGICRVFRLYFLLPPYQWILEQGARSSSYMYQQ